MPRFPQQFMVFLGLEPRSLNTTPTTHYFPGYFEEGHFGHTPTGPWSQAPRSQTLAQVKDHVYLYPVILVTPNAYSIWLDFLYSLSSSGVSIVEVSGV